MLTCMAHWRVAWGITATCRSVEIMWNHLLNCLLCHPQGKQNRDSLIKKTVACVPCTSEPKPTPLPTSVSDIWTTSSDLCCWETSQVQVQILSGVVMMRNALGLYFIGFNFHILQAQQQEINLDPFRVCISHHASCGQHESSCDLCYQYRGFFSSERHL